MAETDGGVGAVFIGSLRAFAPLDLGLVKLKENGRSLARERCTRARKRP